MTTRIRHKLNVNVPAGSRVGCVVLRLLQTDDRGRVHGWIPR